MPLLHRRHRRRTRTLPNQAHPTTSTMPTRTPLMHRHPTTRRTQAPRLTRQQRSKPLATPHLRRHLRSPQVPQRHITGRYFGHGHSPLQGPLCRGGPKCCVTSCPHRPQFQSGSKIERTLSGRCLGFTRRQSPCGDSSRASCFDSEAQPHNTRYRDERHGRHSPNRGPSRCDRSRQSCISDAGVGGGVPCPPSSSSVTNAIFMR